MAPSSILDDRPSFAEFWKRGKGATAGIVKPGVSGKRIGSPMGSSLGSMGSAAAAAAQTPPQRLPLSPNLSPAPSSSLPPPRPAPPSREMSTPAAPPAAAEKTPEEKARARRAQVRRAQIQHRQRKAEYMRQLELDIESLRDLIGDAERDVTQLRQQNDSMRVCLFGSSGDTALPFPASYSLSTSPSSGLATSTPTTTTSTMTTTTSGASADGSPAEMTASASGGLCLDDGGVDVSMILDEYIGSPVYHIAAPALPAWLPSGGDLGQALLPALPGLDDPVYDTATGLLSDLDSLDPAAMPDLATTTPATAVGPASAPAPTPSLAPTLAPERAPLNKGNEPAAMSFALPNMTTDQMTEVVNFILALEHVCWDHSGHQYCRRPSGLRADGGHAMMATALLLRSAPEGVHPAIEGQVQSLGRPWNPAEDDDTFLPGEWEALSGLFAKASKAMFKSEAATPAAASAPVPTPAPTPASTSVAAIVSTPAPHQMDAHNLTLALPGGDLDARIRWRAPSISLHSLYGLAASLNPASDVELAPVQAWFELAAQYPLTVLLRPGVLDELKRALRGIVRCLYFGAVMNRGAFESVVHRIVGPADMVRRVEAVE